tara:strand:+ start:264 stop:908 length:645 start_codon:yes stop_codon:yes gene_type:complete
MEDETTLINSNNKNGIIKDFFLSNKKKLIIIILMLFIILISFFIFDKIQKQNKVKLTNEYNTIISSFNIDKKQEAVKSLSYIVNKKDITYSPLALYFLIDNDLIENKDEINRLFDILIDETNLEKEIRNLIIYKKGLYNSDFTNESDLIKILSPIINSESIWKSHALYLIAEYFYSKNEKLKAIEFYNQITTITNANKDVLLEAKKRLNRDLGE